ncbi:MAG: DUF4083 family protein [Clostridia bacterium]|nr:DUF4083 family protein [Clostridia bacterium]
MFDFAVGFFGEFLPVLGLLLLGGFLIYCSFIYFIAAWRSKHTKATRYEVEDINDKLDRIIELLEQQLKSDSKKDEVKPVYFKPEVKEEKPEVNTKVAKSSDDAPSFPRSAEEYQRLYGNKKTE